MDRHNSQVTIPMAQTHFSVEIHKQPDETAQIQQWKSRSIYKIHPCIKILNEKAFVPQVASFGPYHHEGEHMKLLEPHKERGCRRFLKRCNKEMEDLKGALRPEAERLMNSYDPLGPEWREDQDRFLKMMITDGCFMLELLRIDTDRSSDYDPNDPIFSQHGKVFAIPLIKRDMLKIENQLPMLLLEKLLEKQSEGKSSPDSATTLILKSFFPKEPSQTQLNCLHVLDVYRQVRFPKNSSSPANRGDDSDYGIIPSATELLEAGVRFRSSPETASLRGITFNQRGKLKIPTITVDDTTESIFLNLMAFERFHLGAGSDVTSYIFFMDSIIDSERDVALLMQKGIINNAYGSNKDVANLFNKLSKDITIDPSNKLHEVHKTVNKYCKRAWNRWRANLIHRYFHNPWSIISLVAAICLFELTLVQTIYGILSYYNSNDAPPPPSPKM